MTIKGLIFDFDGLILDTETPEYMVWQEIFHSYGSELPLSEWSGHLGSDAAQYDVINYLERQVGQQLNREEIHQKMDNKYYEMLNQQSILPGVNEYIQNAKGLGLKIAVASSSDLPWVIGHLERLGLLNSFDIICTAENVKRVKPAPELFEYALSRLALQAKESIVFEDTPNGVASAKAAGCNVVAVPNTITRNLNLDGADFILQSMADMPLEDLLGQFS